MITADTKYRDLPENFRRFFTRTDGQLYGNFQLPIRFFTRRGRVGVFIPAACGADLMFLLRKPMVKFAFFVTWSACLLQDRSLLMVTPKYFASVLTFSFWLCMVLSEQRGLFLLVIRITSHLSALKPICHLFSHSWSLSKSS